MTDIPAPADLPDPIGSLLIAVDVSMSRWPILVVGTGAGLWQSALAVLRFRGELCETSSGTTDWGPREWMANDYLLLPAVDPDAGEG